MLVKTEVIVLKSMKYRDTSKIVTFYSKEFGKLKGIAKGARMSKNKFGSSLEPISHSMLLIYKKDHRDIHLISQCDSIESFRKISEDLERMSTGLSILELIDQVTHHEERMPDLFSLLVGTLSALNQSTKNYGVFLQAFQLRLPSLFGYAMNFDVCGECGKPVLSDTESTHVVFQIARGALLCAHCCPSSSAQMPGNDHRSVSTSLSMRTLQIVRSMSTTQLSNLSDLDFDAKTGNEISDLIRFYLRYHFDGIRPLKSEYIFQQQYSTVI